MSEDVAQDLSKVDLTIETKEVVSRGQRLLKARESLSLSIGSVSQQLHMEKRFIVALENDDYSIFSGEVYVYGCMRAYAKLLNLPVDEFTVGISDQDPVSLVGLEVPLSVGEAKKFNPMWIIYFLLVVVIVGIVWLLSRATENENMDVNDAMSSSGSSSIEIIVIDNIVTSKMDSVTDKVMMIPEKKVHAVEAKNLKVVNINRQANNVVLPVTDKKVLSVIKETTIEEQVKKKTFYLSCFLINHPVNFRII